MLRTVSELEGYTIGATDDTVGHISDLYFDDRAWTLRYFIVETGKWLASKKVLISPFAIGAPNWPEKILPASITRKQVRESPDIDTDRPVSQQHEEQFLSYYGYPNYWVGGGLWGSMAYPGAMMDSPALGGAALGIIPVPNLRAQAARGEHEDHHLRSCKEVMKYQIQATDGDIGHVQDMLVEDGTWAIRYLVVNTSNWWLGHTVLVAPQWISSVSWTDEKVLLDLTRDAIKAAPPYTMETQLDRVGEENIYKHYARKGYWSEQNTQR
jgi:uncharacterized protein YrrD